MNVKEYISSGIIEDYLMGNASEKEQQEIECLSSIYPEIQQAIDEKAEELDLIASQFAVDPPAGLKDQIMDSIEGEEQAEAEEGQKETKVEPLPLEQAPVDDGFKPSIESPRQTNRTMWVGIAASVIILVVASWAYFSMDNSYQSQLATLENEKEELEQRLDQLASNYEERIEQLASPAVQRIPLKPVSEGSGQDAIVFWDQEKSKVWLNAEGLETPPEGMQYQLWGLQGDQPIDLGVFTQEEDRTLNNMKDIQSADAFAITLEKEGGVPQPTMEQLQVMGKVSKG